MKNRFLIFLGIFILIIIPKNVFAAQILPYEVKVNNTALSSWGVNNNNRVAKNVNYNETWALNISVNAFDYSAQNIDFSFNTYPYIFVYFVTWNTEEQINITKQSTCTNSCFANDGAFLKLVGTDLTSGKRSYIAAFKAKKWTTDCGVGSGQCVYHIDDVINLKNTRDGDSRNFAIYSVLLSDNIDILNSNTIDIDSMISNANSNTNSIINNANSNTNSITTNATTNTNNIINNATTNTNSITTNNNNNTNKIISNNNNNQAQTHQDMTDLKGQQVQTNQHLTDVNNSLNSDTGVSNNDVSAKANEWSSKNASSGPVSQMVLMPITLLNGYVNGMNSTCSEYNLGSLMGTEIKLPCINISNYLGSNLWSVIDVLFSGFMIYAIGKKFVKMFNDFTNLRDNQMDELYGGGN